MDNNTEQLTEQESLFIIQQMIQSAKHEQKDDGKGWIIWGWMLFLASILTVINIETGWFQAFFFWNIFGIIAIIIAMYQTFVAFFLKKSVRVKTYTKAIFEKLNAGFFISLMFLIVGMNLGIHPMLGFPALMSLYAFWILIYGAILNFKPSLIGAACMWLLAFGAFLVSTFQWVMVLHGIGVLFGYIIPGHIAKREFKKVKARNLNNQHTSV